MNYTSTNTTATTININDRFDIAKYPYVLVIVTNSNNQDSAYRHFLDYIDSLADEDTFCICHANANILSYNLNISEKQLEKYGLIDLLAKYEYPAVSIIAKDVTADYEEDNVFEFFLNEMRKKGIIDYVYV